MNKKEIKKERDEVRKWIIRELSKEFAPDKVNEILHQIHNFALLSVDEVVASVNDVIGGNKWK